ncbi:MAG: hypothetical protein HGA49_03225 [Eubacteriaceae bacterium]|nr:hypothetical protein [Eubacteriaceae bacterium]
MKKLFNRKGMILPFVIIVGAIVIMTGTVLLSTGVLDVKGGNFVERDTQAYFSARSAAEAVAQKLVKGGVSFLAKPDGYTETFTGNIGDAGYTYTADVSKTGKVIKIRAVATHKNVTDEATVYVDEITAVVNDKLDVDLAVYGEKIIAGNGTVDIYNGDIATSTTGSVTLGSNLDLHGGLVKKVDLDYPTPVMDPAPTGLAALAAGTLSGDYTYSGGILSIANNKTCTISLTGDASLTKIDNKGTLRINLNGADKKLRVGSITNSGNIFVSGETANTDPNDTFDDLKLYIDTVFNINGDINWDINAGDPLANLKPQRLIIFDYGTESVGINSSNKFCAYYHVGDVDMTVNGSAGLVGQLVTNSVANHLITYTGGSTNTRFLIYAPDANFKMSGNATLEGAIIAKNVDPIIGTAKITYNAMFDNVVIDGVHREGATHYEVLRWEED